MPLSSLSARKPLILVWVVAYAIVCAAVFTEQLWLRIAALVNVFLAGWLVILAATR
jgi:hypothetical protein